MLCSPVAALVDELPGPLATSRWLAARKGRHLNRRVVLCVIVVNGGRAVGTAMFGSEDATFR